MHRIYQSANRKFCLYITIKCKGKKCFRVWAEDYGKRNSKYADRQIIIEGERKIFFNFPVSPRQLFLGFVNTQDPKDTDFELTLIEGPVKSYNIDIDEETENFLALAIPFCQTCGFTPAGPDGTLFERKGFRIVYYDIIRDVMSGQPMSTPARIGHNSGKIDVSKNRFDKYTIPMRIMILLHEFSHKYKNPKIGLEIQNEFGADINGLYIYLGMGFSKIDAICVFANVFLRAQTPSNMQRIRKINDYIARFENQEWATLN